MAAGWQKGQCKAGHNILARQCKAGSGKLARLCKPLSMAVRKVGRVGTLSAVSQYVGRSTMQEWQQVIFKAMKCWQQGCKKDWQDGHQTGSALPEVGRSTRLAASQ